MTQHIGADKLNHIVKCEVCLKRIAAMESPDCGGRVARKIKPAHKQWDNPNYLRVAQ